MAQHEKKVTNKPVVKKIQTQLKEAPKFPEFVGTELEDSDDDDENQEPIKKVKLTDSAKEKPAKFSGLVDKESEDTDIKYDILRDTGFSRKNIQQVPFEIY